MASWRLIASVAQSESRVACRVPVHVPQTLTALTPHPQSQIPHGPHLSQGQGMPLMPGTRTRTRTWKLRATGTRHASSRNTPRSKPRSTPTAKSPAPTPTKPAPAPTPPPRSIPPSMPRSIPRSPPTSTATGTGTGTGTGSSSKDKATNAFHSALWIVGGFAGGVFYMNNGGSGSATKEAGVYATQIQMLQAAREIALRLGNDAVTVDSEVLELHGHSEWSTSNSPGRAVAVVYPRSTEDCQEIARVCSSRSVPMVPYGAGSSVEGNFSQPFSGICVDFAHMDKVVAFHPEDMDVVVQPGVNWVDLNARIAGSRLFAPMDPSPTATVGGMVSTNCSGTNAMRYGTMKDWVVNLTVVLPDGTLVKTRRRPRKSSAGYNLTSLFVGAEGTLGLVTEVTLRLAPVPQDTGVAVVAFPTIRDAAAAAAALIRSGVRLAALELMDEVQMQMLNRHGSEAVRRRRWDERPTLFLRFAGTAEAIAGDVRRASQLVGPLASGPCRLAASRQEEHDLWAARKEVLFTMVGARPPGTEVWSTDVAVPLSRLAEIIDVSKRECGQLGIFASVVGHVGDGNFHVSMMYDPKDAEMTARVGRVVKDMMGRALEMDGTVSGEHAIGIGKKAALRDELGDDTIGLMQAIKAAVDPMWIMNPGKVFDMPGAARRG